MGGVALATPRRRARRRIGRRLTRVELGAQRGGPEHRAAKHPSAADIAVVRASARAATAGICASAGAATAGIGASAGAATAGIGASARATATSATTAAGASCDAAASNATPRDEAVVLSSYDDFSDKTQVDAAAHVQREALQSGVQITDMPAPSEVSPRSVTMPSPPSSEQTISTAQFTRVVEIKRPAVRPAVRVAVTRDPESPDTWLVRPLPEGSEVPPGCEEALLVALDPQSRLLQ